MEIIICEKNITQHLKGHCTEIDVIRYIAIRYFFSQINLAFKSKPVFIDILNSFCLDLSKFLPVDFYLYSSDFEVHTMCLRLFIKNSKVWMRFNVIFLRFSFSKCSYVLVPDYGLS